MLINRRIARDLAIRRWVRNLLTSWLVLRYMGIWRDVRDLKRSHPKYKSKQFYENPTKQLLLVEDFSCVNERVFDGFVDVAVEILRQNPQLSSRLSFYEKYLTEKAERMINIAKSSNG